MSLDGKVALVTGAAKGIGKACAQALGTRGVRIAVVDIDAVVGLQTAQGITASGGHAAFLPADVSKATDVQKMIGRLMEVFGRLDILVNNAGYHISKNVEDTSEEEWDYILNTNLKSVFLCSKYAIPHLRQDPGGYRQYVIHGWSGRPNQRRCVFGDERWHHRHDQRDGSRFRQRWHTGQLYLSGMGGDPPRGGLV